MPSASFIGMLLALACVGLGLLAAMRSVGRSAAAEPSNPFDFDEGDYEPGFFDDCE